MTESPSDSCYCCNFSQNYVSTIFLFSHVKRAWVNDSHIGVINTSPSHDLLWSHDYYIISSCDKNCVIRLWSIYIGFNIASVEYSQLCAFNCKKVIDGANSLCKFSYVLPAHIRVKTDYKLQLSSSVSNYIKIERRKMCHF